MSKKGSFRSADISKLQRLLHSIWFFPLLLLVPLVLLTAFKISGSSIGIYHSYFYGNTKDPDLILNKPELIRSDEWIVNTPMTIAQKNNHFERVNKNIGDGEDMSVLLDVPYKEWSELFKPHNLVFFVLPFEYAFAFKWWLMAYLLVVSCYLFILALLPGRKLLAAILSLSFMLSAFVQWWYLYITLGPLYYSFFIATAYIHLLRQKRLMPTLLLGGVISYLLTCFVLVLYPPFQIACGLALGAFVVGYLLEQKGKLPGKDLLKKLGILAASVVFAGAVCLTFVATRSNVIKTINSTAYPGKRVVSSGGYSKTHLFSGQLDLQFQNLKNTAAYQITQNGITNQSEDSSFLLLLPFLFLPCMYVLYRDYRLGNRLDFPLALVNIAFLIMLSWLFIPRLGVVGKLLLLNKVPLNRTIIGLGLLNLFQVVLLMRHLRESKTKWFSNNIILLCAILIFALEMAINFHAKHIFPGFIGTYRAVAFALPIPVIIYALLRGWFVWCATGLLTFSILIVAGVNPLYRGTSTLTNTPLSLAIKSISSQNSGKWATDVSSQENFASMNGASSLSGVYEYPQLSLWKSIDSGKQSYIYNRYAHVNFNFDRDASINIPTKLELVGGDNFGVITEPCGSFLRVNNVRFITTTTKLNTGDQCAQLIDTVSYPGQSIYIYRLH